MAKQELVPFKANNLVVQSTSQLPVIVANVEYDKLDDEQKQWVDEAIKYLNREIA